MKAQKRNKKKKNNWQGNNKELGNNIYQCKTRMTETIADYVGKEYSNEMGLLVKNQEENEPKEAVMPDNKEAK